ncbi:MAG TPA: CotH kinase family protein, partial [Verrucomicrobiae bacterium]
MARRFAFLLSIILPISASDRLLLAASNIRLQPPVTSSAFFQLTNIWTAHFTFEREQWRAMQATEEDGAGPRGWGQNGPNLIGRPGTRNGLSSVRGVVFNYAHASLEIAGTNFPKVAVRYKGNGTWFRSSGNLKQSLKVDLNEFNKKLKLAGVSMLNFHTEVSDPAWMNEALSYQLYRDAKVPSPRVAYAKAYLTIRGGYQHRYLGLYSIVENIDHHFLKENFGAKEGAIFKPVGPDL